MTDFSGRRQGSSLVEEIDPPSGWTEDSSYHYLLVKLPGFSKEWLDLQVHDSGHIVVGGERQTENKIFRFEQTFKIPENSDTENISGKHEDGILYVIVPKLVKDKLEERKPPKTATDEHIRGKKHEQEHDQEERDKKHKHRQDEKHQHDREEHDERHKHHQEEQDEKQKHRHRHDQEHQDQRHKHHQEEQDEKQKHRHRHDQEHQDQRHKHHQEEKDERHEHELDKEEHYGGGHIGHRGEEVPTATWTREGGVLGSAVEILSRNKGIAATAVLAFALGVFLSQKIQSNAGSGGGLPPM